MCHPKWRARVFRAGRADARWYQLFWVKIGPPKWTACVFRTRASVFRRRAFIQTFFSVKMRPTKWCASIFRTGRSFKLFFWENKSHEMVCFYFSEGTHSYELFFCETPSTKTWRRGRQHSHSFFLLGKQSNKLFWSSTAAWWARSGKKRKMVEQKSLNSAPQMRSLYFFWPNFAYKNWAGH